MGKSLLTGCVSVPVPGDVVIPLLQERLRERDSGEGP
jgi:hypothetical protein